MEEEFILGSAFADCVTIPSLVFSHNSETFSVPSKSPALLGLMKKHSVK